MSKLLDMPPEKVKQVMKASLEPVSLDRPIGEDEDSNLGDFIEDTNAPSPARQAAHAMLQDRMGRVLSTLTRREEKVIRLRFGLGDGTPRTLEEVGTIFKVTRERIRQIEAKALRKLRHPTRSDYLRSFLDEKGSDDCQGRALWGLGYVMAFGPRPMTPMAKDAFDRLAEALATMPDGMDFAEAAPLRHRFPDVLAYGLEAKIDAAFEVEQDGLHAMLYAVMRLVAGTHQTAMIVSYSRASDGEPHAALAAQLALAADEPRNGVGQVVLCRRHHGGLVLAQHLGQQPGNRVG